MQSGFLTQLVAGVFISFLAMTTSRLYFKKHESIIYKNNTPIKNTYRFLGNRWGSFNRIVIIFQFLLFMLFNVMLTRKCLDKIIWGTQDTDLWKSCISGAVAVVILLFLVNIGVARLVPFSFLVPLLIIFMFIIYNAVELGLWINAPGNNIVFGRESITMMQASGPDCTINYLNIEPRLAPNMADALTFYLGIFAIPSYVQRLPSQYAKKINFKSMIAFVYIIIACSSVIYLPWTICNKNGGMAAIGDYIMNSDGLLTSDLSQQIMLGFKIVQQLSMVTLFGRYVLYDIIEMYQDFRDQVG
jgi:hypothetical protein